MNFIRMLIGLPILIIILVFAFVNNDFATFNLWPFYFEVTVSLSVAIVFFIFLGFVLGTFFSWLSYAPLRKALRKQKKENKKLNKEQQKLVKEVKGLHDNIETLKSDDAQKSKPKFGQKLRNLFKSKKKQSTDNSLK